MKFWDKIQTRDILAAIMLIGGLVLTAMGIDKTISVVMAAIIGYYFSKRVYEEKNK
jgi:hypothetical protein